MKEELERIEKALELELEGSSEEDTMPWFDNKPILISKIKETMIYLQKGENMVNALDWYMSGDDGIDTFKKKWAKNEV
jgi:hypothetical protein